MSELLTPAQQSLIAPIDQHAMLDHAQSWSAINTGTANLDGLATMVQMLADAFAVLPGDVALADPAPVTAIGTDGREFAKPHGQHVTVSIRPEAERRLLFTGHMDTVFPADSAFQNQLWLDDDTLNGPGLADMKGGIAVFLHALIAFEQSDVALRIGYDIILNSDEETGSLASAPLIERLAQGKYAALTYEPSALPDGTLAHARGGSGNYSLTVTGTSAHAGRNPGDGRNAIVAAADIVDQMVRSPTLTPAASISRRNSFSSSPRAPACIRAGISSLRSSRRKSLIGLHSRHCERSEAIQFGARWIAASPAAPRNDGWG